VNKETFLEAIITDYSPWKNLLEKLSSEDMLKSGACGLWSIKDIIAHIAWYEHEMVSLIDLHELIGSKLWDLSTDERNQIIFQQNKDRSLKNVIEESGKIHNAFIQALNTLTDKDLLDASHFKNMPGDWVPWEVIAGNSYEHYKQHIPDLMQQFSY
jgi:hypothetical protein